jgi:hypothetical protein
VVKGGYSRRSGNSAPKVGEEGGVAVDEVDVDLSAVRVNGETIKRRLVFVVVVFFDVREVSFHKVDGFPVRNVVVFVPS